MPHRPLLGALVALLPLQALADQGLLFHASFDDTLEAYSLSGAGNPLPLDGDAQPTFQPKELT